MNVAVQNNKEKETAIMKGFDGGEHTTLAELTDVSKKLLDIAEEENKSLSEGNISRFSLLQKDKEPLARIYIELAREFEQDIRSSKTADKDSLLRLEILQASLQEKARINNALIENIAKKKIATTGSTLFAAQEIAQQEEAQR